MTSDPWLDPWLPLIAARVGALPILELGCGTGRDTMVLEAAGHRVVALDLSLESITEALRRAPACEFRAQDIRAAFPASAARVNVVIASLSLHYFSWPETLLLARRIADVLEPSGVLLCRLNSINDHHHGASGHPPVADPLDEHYRLVDGEPKRFFTRTAVKALFAFGWHILHLEEKVVHRYAKPKALWEVVLERSP